MLEVCHFQAAPVRLLWDAMYRESGCVVLVLGGGSQIIRVQQRL